MNHSPSLMNESDVRKSILIKFIAFGPIIPIPIIMLFTGPVGILLILPAYLVGFIPALACGYIFSAILNKRLIKTPGYLFKENGITLGLFSGMLLGMVLFVPAVIYFYIQNGFDVVLPLSLQSSVSYKVSEWNLQTSVLFLLVSATIGCMCVIASMLCGWISVKKLREQESLKRDNI